EVLATDAPLEPLAHFLDVVLEAAQRCNVAVVYLAAVANHANARLSIDHAAAYRAAGNDPHARNLEQLADLGFAKHDFLLFGPQHSLECSSHVFDRFVDDLVQLDL